MKYSLSDLIDLQALESLLETLHQVTGLTLSLVDSENRVVAAVAWAKLCRNYHRANPQTNKRCQESINKIISVVSEGGYAGCDCPNGLADYATPIVIDGEQIANVFASQMFHAPPDLESFRRQAKIFGFDETSYLEAVRQVPIISRERIPDIMALLAKLAQMLAKQGSARLRQLEAEQNLRQLNEELAQRVRERTEELLGRNRQLSQIVAQYEETEAAFRQEQQFANNIINSLPGIFYLLDQHGENVRWNRKLSELSGYSNQEIIGMPATSFFDDEEVPYIRQKVAETLTNGEANAEATFITKDGRKIPMLFTGIRTFLDSEPFVVGLGIDITARKELEVELAKQANEDSLTGAATRRHFLHCAEQELARSRRYGSPLSALMLDIDKFKGINDDYGHNVGDQLLRQLAEACRQTLRAVDIVGRLGGDEFAIILPETGADQAREVAQRLRLAIGDIDINLPNGANLHCTVSIGVTTVSSPFDGVDELLRQADEALYQSKTAGRDQVTTFLGGFENFQGAGSY